MEFQNKLQNATTIDQILIFGICHPVMTICLGMATFHYPANTRVKDQIAMVIGHFYLMKEDIGDTLRISRKYPSECRKKTGIFNVIMINQSYDIYKEMYPDMEQNLQDFEQKYKEIKKKHSN